MVGVVVVGALAWAGDGYVDRGGDYEGEGFRRLQVRVVQTGHADRHNQGCQLGGHFLRASKSGTILRAWCADDRLVMLCGTVLQNHLDQGKITNKNVPGERVLGYHIRCIQNPISSLAQTSFYHLT